VLTLVTASVADLARHRESGSVEPTVAGVEVPSQRLCPCRRLIPGSSLGTASDPFAAVSEQHFERRSRDPGLASRDPHNSSSSDWA
jgi:hypothetical protein